MTSNSAAASSELRTCGRSDSGRASSAAGAHSRGAAHGRERPTVGLRAGSLLHNSRLLFCDGQQLAEHSPPEAKRGVASVPCRCSLGQRGLEGPCLRIALRRSELGPGRSCPSTRGVEPHPARLCLLSLARPVGRLPRRGVETGRCHTDRYHLESTRKSLASRKPVGLAGVETGRCLAHQHRPKTSDKASSHADWCSASWPNTAHPAARRGIVPCCGVQAEAKSGLEAPV